MGSWKEKVVFRRLLKGGFELAGGEIRSQGVSYVIAETLEGVGEGVEEESQGKGMSWRRSKVR